MMATMVDMRITRNLLAKYFEIVMQDRSANIMWEEKMRSPQPLLESLLNRMLVKVVGGSQCSELPLGSAKPSKKSPTLSVCGEGPGSEAMNWNKVADIFIYCLGG